MRAFWHLVFVGATGVPTYLTVYYYYELMTRIGLLLVVPVGLFVFLQIMAVLWLQKRRNPVLAALGNVFGVTLQYLALFEGLVLTVLVFFVLGGGDASGDRAVFYGDLVFGALYLSAFVYGATGLTAAVSVGGLGAMVGGLYALVAIGLPLWLVIFHDDAIRTLASGRLDLLLMTVLGYCVGLSVIGMWLLSLPVSRAMKTRTDARRNRAKWR